MIFYLSLVVIIMLFHRRKEQNDIDIARGTLKTHIAARVCDRSGREGGDATQLPEWGAAVPRAVNTASVGITMGLITGGTFK